MTRQYPFYFKSTIILLGLILLVHILSSLRDIIVPLAFASLLAILLNPLNDWFLRKKLPMVLSIVCSMFIALIVISGVMYFVSSQMASFGDEMPLLKERSIDLFTKFQHWAQGALGISMEKQQQLFDEATTALKSLAGHTLGTVLDSLSIIALLPVYTFLFLYYKKLILNFLFEIIADKNAGQVREVLQATKGAIQNYMVGLLLEGVIVAILNSVALLIIGVKYAILLGVLGAIVNVLPYIGGITAILFPIIIATITKDGIHTQIYITIAYIVIQFIDNHLIVPMVVSSRVQINALISVIVVLLGGALWGISGMFLSIPFIGVIKIVFDHIPELKPWGKLLGIGETIPDKKNKKLVVGKITGKRED